MAGAAITPTREAEPIRAARSSSNGTPDALPQPRQYQVNASFGEANLIIYRILDKQTGSLIQQIPPEQLLEMARSVRELLQTDETRRSLDFQI